jgi:hypothetical protein
MVHAPKTFVFGGARELIAGAGSLEKLGERHFGLLARTGQPPEVIAQWMGGRDFYFSAAQAKEAGLIDEIILPPPGNEVPSAMPAMEAQEIGAAPTSDEILFQKFLKAFGTVEVRDVASFVRECASWATHNSKRKEI